MGSGQNTADEIGELEAFHVIGIWTLEFSCSKVGVFCFALAFPSVNLIRGREFCLLFVFGVFFKTIVLKPAC